MVWSGVVFKPLVPARLPPGLWLLPGGLFLGALFPVLSIKLLAALLFCKSPGAILLLLITLYQDLQCFQNTLKHRDLYFLFQMINPLRQSFRSFILQACLTSWVGPSCHSTRTLLQFYEGTGWGWGSASRWPSQLALSDWNLCKGAGARVIRVLVPSVCYNWHRTWQSTPSPRSFLLGIGFLQQWVNWGGLGVWEILLATCHSWGEIIAQTVHFREGRPLSSLLQMPSIWELKKQMVADMP